jgi:hypothetical protein
VCSRLYSKQTNRVCTRYPGVHSTFTCYQPNLRLILPMPHRFQCPKLFPCPPLARFLALSRSWLFPVPSLARFLALLTPCPGGRGGAAYGGRRRGGRRAEEGGAAYGTTGASGVWDCKRSVRCSSTKVLVRRECKMLIRRRLQRRFCHQIYPEAALVFHHFSLNEEKGSRWTDL